MYATLHIDAICGQQSNNFFLLEKSCTMPNNTQEMGKYSKINFFEILRHPNRALTDCATGANC